MTAHSHTAHAWPRLDYHAMRLRWCRVALLAFLRRWGVYFAVAAAVIGAGAVGAWTLIAAVAAWFVTPLFHAASQGAWLAPAFIVQAFAGVACVWGMRSLLWPAQWAEAERALPIGRREMRKSDAIVVTLALSPLMLLYAIGASTLLGHDPAWLHAVRGRAVLALLLACAGSIGLGVALLQQQRAPHRVGPHRLQKTDQAAAPPGSASPAMGWLRAVLWLPLWRGPAKRTGHALLLGAAALCVPAMGLFFWSHAAGWWLAGFATIALVAVTRVNALAREELTGLIEACRVLPLAPPSLKRVRASLPLLLLMPGCAALLAGMPKEGVRPAGFALYLACCALACAVEVASPSADAEAKSARWLFSLVLCISVATEVMA